MSTLSRLRRVIEAVPRGRVITYGQVAEAAGYPRAARLTVWALQAGEGLPWHRVVAVGGRIALTGSEGREQRLRLEVEGVTFRSGRVRMDVHGWVPRRRKTPRVRPRGTGLDSDVDWSRPELDPPWRTPTSRRRNRRRSSTDRD